MFGNKNTSSSKGTKIDTLIGQNSELQGDIHFSGGLHVDGTIKGMSSLMPKAAQCLA